MVVIKYKSAEEAKHLLHKIKRMKKDIEEVMECLEEKMYESEGYDEEEYDESYRGNTSYRGDGGSFRRYRMGR